jgi:Trk K+ transport system NAD-binding subunit
VKTLAVQISAALENREVRKNLPLLMRLVWSLVVVVVVFTIMFHFIMVYEGQDHSWITGVYWTLTVMSTLGFGDITFTSDLGRGFSVIVLITGIVMLLIVLPFAFIRFFYAPWLDAQTQALVPRELPEDTEGHVIICANNVLAVELIDWLVSAEIPYVVLEPDGARAAAARHDGISLLVGRIDSGKTYTAARVGQARLVIANLDDIVNTNIALTVRAVAPDVPIAAIATHDDAIDVLELSGVNHVLPVKRWLGEQLANRINSERTGLHPIGSYEELRFAELPVCDTSLVGQKIRDTALRDETGVTIIGVWDHGKFRHATPELSLTRTCVPVLMGTDEQLATLDDLFDESPESEHPVIVIGGGSVGAAALRAMEPLDIPVHLIERDAERCELLAPLCRKTFSGDASSYELVKSAGIEEATSVLLTTNDDAMNIFLTSYCRRLNPNLRIVSRLSSEFNLDSIHRAGADFVLSYATLGVNAISSVIHQQPLAVLGEGIDLFPFTLTPSLNMVSLDESRIADRTGMKVVAVRTGADTITDLEPNFRFEPGMELLLIGSTKQFERMHHLYP